MFQSARELYVQLRFVNTFCLDIIIVCSSKYRKQTIKKKTCFKVYFDYFKMLHLFIAKRRFI